MMWLAGMGRATEIHKRFDHCRPVLIGGCPRSGTTMLGAMLGAAAEAAVTPESHFKQTMLLSMRGSWESGISRDRLARKLPGKFRFRLWNVEFPDVRDWPESLSPEQYGQLLFALVDLYHSRQGGGDWRIWVDHTPQNIQNPLMLKKIFPNARFLHIVRDPRAVAASLLKLDWGPGTAKEAARFWAQKLSFGLACEQAMGGDCLRVYYEDILRSPEKTLQEVCAFCGLTYDARMVEGGGFSVPAYTKNQHALVGGRPNADRIHAWRGQLDPWDLADLESQLEDLHLMLGYPAHPGGDLPDKPLRKRCADVTAPFRSALRKKRHFAVRSKVGAPDAKKAVVGIVLPYLKSRGTENQALRLSRELCARGHSVVVFVVQGWGLDSMYDAFRDLGVEVVNVGPPLDNGRKTVRWRRLLPLAGCLRRNRCDVVISRAEMTNRITAHAARLAGVPSVAVLSSAVKVGYRSRFAPVNLLLSGLAWRRLGFPRRIVTVSREGAKRFGENYPFLLRRLRPICNGVELPDGSEAEQSGRPWEAGRFAIGYCGSLELKRKGLDILLEALKILVTDKSIPDILLVLIGKGDDESSLRTRVEEQGLSGHVCFAGEQPEPGTWMRHLDLFVLASRWEGMPNVLLEAMALGVCSVASDCPTGPGEILQNGENGLLVPVGDAHSLAAAITRLHADPEMRGRMGARGRETVRQRYSSGVMTEQYVDLIQSLI